MDVRSYELRTCTVRNHEKRRRHLLLCVIGIPPVCTYKSRRPLDRFDDGTEHRTALGGMS